MCFEGEIKELLTWIFHLCSTVWVQIVHWWFWSCACMHKLIETDALRSLTSFFFFLERKLSEDHSLSVSNDVKEASESVLWCLNCNCRCLCVILRVCSHLFGNSCLWVCPNKLHPMSQIIKKYIIFFALVFIILQPSTSFLKLLTNQMILASKLICCAW